MFQIISLFIDFFQSKTVASSPTPSTLYSYGYTLRSMSHFSEREEVQTEAGEEEFSQLTFPCTIDDEDFKGCSLDNVLPEHGMSCAP